MSRLSCVCKLNYFGSQVCMWIIIELVCRRNLFYFPFFLFFIHTLIKINKSIQYIFIDWIINSRVIKNIRLELVINPVIKKKIKYKMFLKVQTLNN